MKRKLREEREKENFRPGRREVRWEMIGPKPLGAGAVRLRREQGRVQGVVGQGLGTDRPGVGQRRENG